MEGAPGRLSMELTLNHISKRYRQDIVFSDVSASLGTGLCALIGENGSGKSTLMKMLAGILLPDNGRVCLDGKDIRELGSLYRRRIGYLPQTMGLYPDMTVEQYLFYIASLKGLRPIVAREDMRQIMEDIWDPEILKEGMSELSGGQQKLVGIVQARLGDPDILLLDEAMAELDRDRMFTVLKSLRAYADSHLVILSSHLTEDIVPLADMVLKTGHGGLAYEKRNVWGV
jgi:ABC-2 type transport system ATP-binding protein